MAAKETPAPFFSKRLAVQPFPISDSWINTARPIKLDQLKGKFVLLDFWTLGCINCMHIIPELKKIEAAWPNNLVVIGVHSAKFQEEKNTKIITQAVLRYGVQHPVINDSDFTVWKSFGIQAWPSLVLIDPDGFAVWGHSGEVTFEQLDTLLKPAVAHYRKLGLLDEKPLVFEPESKRAARTPLSFPGKVFADEPGNRLFIADSGHNRIVIARIDGTLLDTIGDGRRGQSDGDYAQARFNSPQGMALHGDMLYVADTENHLIRKIDLSKKQVTTIAGTGHQSRDVPPFAESAKPRKTALNSPWALWIQGNFLFIAMAGSHQIWEMPLDETAIEVYAGNGVEDIVDGPLAPRKPYQTGFASFAQPSGLASDGIWLYVADAEGSSIRAVPFDHNKKVRTVVGTAHLPDARLFTFGDVDGPAYQAKLQHPLGIVYREGKLYIADTYNNKIKVVDPIHGDTQTLAGTGSADYAENPPAFNNPMGLSTAGGKLFVADTNNHAIRVIDLDKDNKVSTLEIPSLKPPDSM
ncbi:MAG: thioredoxin-like domain-containing protein [Thermoguttaceae bacterium]|jgi:thiol-disulfide isomerase/thioredoxin/sugar lactone lactonase YvrE